MNKRKNSILIVDDERSNISVLKNILSPEYTIYASSDGQDAIETAEEFLPDVILLDVIMPKMDGYEIITALKSSKKTKNIPVIFVTGLDNTESEEKGLALGAVDYILKPFHSPIVKLRVHNQIKLVEQLRQQALITQISHSFLSDAYVDSLFADTLQMVGKFMNIPQLLLYKIDDNGVFICHSEWMHPELNLETRIGDKFELNETLVKAIRNVLDNNKEYLCFHSNDPTFKEILKPYRKNFQSYITTPIFVKGKIGAFLDFSRIDDGREWNESEINLAILVSDVFTGVFERDAMERQFSIVENSPDLILSITPEAVVEYANPAASVVTGHTKNEIVSEGLGIIFGNEKLADIKGKYIPDAIMQGQGKTVQFEMDIIHKDGGKRILAISIFQIGKNNLSMIIRDLTKIRELEIENKKIFFDGLTNIYNRRFFDESITRIIKSSSRSGSVLSLMMIDIDFFKNYNDTYGHSAGDDCLRIVANILKKCMPRADDFVARYGGEEFVIVLPNTDESGARNVAERLLANIREGNILHEASAAANHITISIGITTGNVKRTHVAEDFIKRADEMLYKSKQGGRDRCTFGSLDKL